MEASTTTTSSQCEAPPPIREYLLPLYHDPDELLAMMTLDSVYLSGSRAAGYFYPWATCPQSDWDFYCVGSCIQRRAFRRWMVSVGFEVTSENDHYDGVIGTSNVITGYLPRNTNVVNFSQAPRAIVQLISPVYTDIISTVLNFSHTLPMCYISGSHAASLYDVFSRLKLSWMRDMDSIYTKDGRAFCIQSLSENGTDNTMAILKYTHRGVTFCTKCPEVPYTTLGHGTSIHMNRRVGDMYSRLVEFPLPPPGNPMHPMADVNAAILSNLKQARWCTMDTGRNAVTVCADFSVIINNIPTGSTSRCRILEHAVEVRAVDAHDRSSSRYTEPPLPVDGSTVIATSGDKTLACTYFRPREESMSRNWESVGVREFAHISMLLLVNGTMRDYAVSDEVRRRVTTAFGK